VSSGQADEETNEYGARPEINKVLVIAITSDKGLCGAFNSNVFRTTTSLLKEKYTRQYTDANVVVMPIGKKAFDNYRKRGFKLVPDFAGLFSELSFENVKAAAEYAMEAYKRGEYDRVELVYNEFKNVATQVLRAEQFLPIEEAKNEGGEINNNIDYIFEPSKDYIVDELIPTSLKIQFYKALLESNAAEHGARMTAMDKATDNAGDLLRELKLKYNRTRQAAITTEILEIVAGAEALGGR
jgi:F-type H+-transporting ATPase subunit gamma